MWWSSPPAFARRDTLGRYGDLAIAERGGIVIDDHCLTSDPDIYAIGGAPPGRLLLRAGGPGYKMAQITVDRLLGGERPYCEGRTWAPKLKLLGVSVGDPSAMPTAAPQAATAMFPGTSQAGVYKKIVVSGDNACSAPCWWVTWKITAACCR